eukprot:2869121-Alexandrium_andersonii.AAC.1
MWSSPGPPDVDPAQALLDHERRPSGLLKEARDPEHPGGHRVVGAASRALTRGSNFQEKRLELHDGTLDPARHRANYGLVCAAAPHWGHRAEPVSHNVNGRDVQ